MKRTIDMWQGYTEVAGEEASFGYVHGNDGGYFFTWRDTLDETINSVEVDDISGDGGLREEEVQVFLRSYLPTSAEGSMLWGEPTGVTR